MSDWKRTPVSTLKPQHLRHLVWRRTILINAKTRPKHQLTMRITFYKATIMANVTSTDWLTHSQQSQPHSLIDSHSQPHSLIDSLTHYPTHWLTHSLNHSLIGPIALFLDRPIIKETKNVKRFSKIKNFQLFFFFFKVQNRQNERFANRFYHLGSRHSWVNHFFSSISLFLQKKFFLKLMCIFYYLFIFN